MGHDAACRRGFAAGPVNPQLMTPANRKLGSELCARAWHAITRVASAKRVPALDQLARFSGYRHNPSNRCPASRVVGEVVAAGVPKHVRPNAAELCGLASNPHDVVDGPAGKLCLPLGHEQPGQVVLAGGEVALNGAQLVTSNRRRYAV
jgi:hypothetical protein